MATAMVIGAQWGDEGKGKIVDYLAAKADVVVRSQGGNNAGHTVVTGGKAYPLRLMPSGIMYPGTICIVGTGVVVDPKSFLEEMEKLHNSFFVETIHEMRTPLSLVLGSLSELLQRKNDIDSSEATQLLSAYRNTLALQDLIEQLRNTRHGDDVANHLRIARYDMISITKQICDL